MATPTILQVMQAIESIAADLRVGDSEHVDVPGMGRIQFRTTKPALRVADHVEAMKWVEEHEREEFVRVTRSLDVVPFKAFAAEVLRTDGECLPGVEQTPETTSMSISWKVK
mgnify:CR=1 FL=1